MEEILINKEDNLESVLLVNNGILVEKYQYENNKKALEGNIYIGIIKDILIGMQAAFIDIGEEKNAFIHLEDILGKDFSKNDVSSVRIGMPIVVQVKKDSVDNKGARISTKIQVPGRFLIYMPKDNFITVSQKIEDEEEKKRLISIAKKYLPENCGAIMRTACNNKSEEDIKYDIESTINLWNDINKKINYNSKKPALIYESPSISKRMIIDMIDRDVNKIVVNSEEDINEIKNLLVSMKHEDIKIELKKQNLLEMYDIKKTIDETAKRKIWLKCGGFITIDKTEALTAIDVNSGKFVGKENLEKTVFKVNKDAAIEIARQLRLRDIGGIIIIDFIDMHSDENKNEIIDILLEQLKNDRAKTQIMGFSKLNLLEMTRKHMHSS